MGRGSSLQNLDSQTISTMATMPNKLPNMPCMQFSSSFMLPFLLPVPYPSPNMLPGPPLCPFIYFFTPAAFARSAKASRRLNFASSMTPAANQYLLPYPSLSLLQLTRISITRKVSRPLNECMTFVWTRSDREETNSADYGRVSQLRRGSDDGVGNEVIDSLPQDHISHYPLILHLPMLQTKDTHGMLLLLDLKNSAINKSPLDYISL